MKATTDGVVRAPSAFSRTLAPPFSKMLIVSSWGVQRELINSRDTRVRRSQIDTNMSLSRACEDINVPDNGAIDLATVITLGKKRGGALNSQIG